MKLVHITAHTPVYTNGESENIGPEYQNRVRQRHFIGGVQYPKAMLAAIMKTLIYK